MPKNCEIYVTVPTPAMAEMVRVAINAVLNTQDWPKHSPMPKIEIYNGDDYSDDGKDYTLPKYLFENDVAKWLDMDKYAEPVRKAMKLNDEQKLTVKAMNEWLIREGHMKQGTRKSWHFKKDAIDVCRHYLGLDVWQYEHNHGWYKKTLSDTYLMRIRDSENKKR